MNETNESEVARLTSLIEAEYQATQRVFVEFTAQGRHAFITARPYKLCQATSQSVLQ